MYQHTAMSSQPKRRKKRPIHGVKTVDVTRGKSGYGFTISGQHPCILSCIVSGSPADTAGLKAGDYLVSVNGLNISKALHDDVVRMVGMSTGTLTLQVAENYNSSDSSDEEYHHRSKARYPNRVRPRHASSSKHGEKVLTENNQRDRHSSNERHKHSHRSSHDSYNKLSQSGPRLHTPVGAENNLSGSSHNSTPQFAGPLNVEKRRDNPTLNGNSTSAINHPLAKQAIVKSTLSSSQSTSFTRPVPSGSVSNHRRDCINRSNNLNASYVTPAVSSYLKTSAGTTHDSSPNNAFIAMEEDDDDMGDDEASLLDRSIHDIRAVVGYIGSIEMPSDANKPHVRLQSIRNAVRRLRVEQKIHTLVLMEVSPDGVKLTNAMATTVAHYPVDRLAFSGVCPDDKRFFGIVTLHSFVNDEASSDNGNQNESASSGSCHVFMVDPEMRSHNIHAQKAKTFGITCTPTPDQNQCSEFPKSATPIILSITNLYKNRPGTACLDNEVALSQAFADPSRAAQRSCSNSSNSDSGLGFSKDDQTGERVCVVDMPQGAVAAPVKDPPKSQEEWSGQSMTLSNGPVQHCSPGIRTIPTPLHSSYRPVSDVRSRLDASTSSEDSSFFKHTGNDKLNVRAMPGPLNGIMPPPSAFDPFDRQSADNLRASTHKLYQNRQQKMNNHANSDQESNTSHGSDICRSFSHPDLQRSTSAPFQQLSEESFMGHYNSSKVEAIDMDDSKLSPRAFLPPPFHQLRSPSAPPMINGRSSDAESDIDMADTSIVSNLVDQFGRAQAFNFNSPADGRRFSESFAVLRKREKERITVDDGEKWVKPHASVRQRRVSRLQQPLSHSHESLVALEQEIANQKFSSAGSVNNINNQVAVEEDPEDEIGRIAGWAVSFDKLLQDKGGLAVFSDFLKQEYSEENIIFWRTCESYKKITDSDKRKAKAKDIFMKHISVKASDPINIEYPARQDVEKQLDSPNTNMFDVPQQEIFKLMKQDSYPRFIKSELYKTYLMREMEGKSLDLPKDRFQDSSAKEKDKKEDKKKSSKNKEEKEEKDKEKRRRSLLPWRQKHSKQNLKATSDSDLKKSKNDKATASLSSSTKEREVNNNTQRKPVPGPGIDLSTMRKEVQANTKEVKGSTLDNEEDESNFKFCRVIIPDGSTTVVCAKPGQSIRSVLGKLCDKRGLSIAAVDVFLLGSEKPLDLSDDISTLGSKEVMIERRVLFRMDLPNRKSIGVKAKPNRSIRDVFKPILNKYGFKLDAINVQLSGKPGLVDVEAEVSSIDNQRVVITTRDESAVGNIERHCSTSRQSSPKIAVKYPPDFHANKMEGTRLDVITNQVFEDLMHGKSKSAHKFDELGILDPDTSAKIQKNSEDHRSLGLFGLLRKDSMGGGKDQQKTKTKHKVTFNLQKNQTRKTPKDPDDDRFFELLNKVQSHRLDDQRGLDTQNNEIPEFLRNKTKYLSGRESAPPILARDYSKSPHSKRRSDIPMSEADNYIHTDGENFASYTRGHVSTRPSSVSLDSMSMEKRDLMDSGNHQGFRPYSSPTHDALAFSNTSFSSDGVIPSPSEGQSYFQASTAPNSPDFDDPCLAEKSLKDIGFDYSNNMYQAKAWGYSRHKSKFATSRQLQSTYDASLDQSLDDTLTMDTKEDDFDKTIVESPDIKPQSRPHSVPPPNNISHNQSLTLKELAKQSTKMQMESTPKVKQGHIIKLDQSNKGRNSPMQSPIQANYFKGRVTSEATVVDLNKLDRTALLDIGNMEENVTFV